MSTSGHPAKTHSTGTDKAGTADKMHRAATLQDVADATGLHRSTVSRALRDETSIPPATRERVKAAARRLSYRANPLVTVLMKSRRSGRAAQNAVLAYVTTYPTRYGWRPPELDEPDFFPGAVERARQLGYRVEHFWMAEPGMTPKRFSQILSARGIHGILIGRLPVNRRQLELEWDSFSCVALGLTLESPGLHHVAENHYWTTRHSVQQCIERGYRRIGFALSTPNSYPRVGDRRIGGYCSLQHRLAEEDRIPLYAGGPYDRDAFLAWFRLWRPDALLVSRAAAVLNWLREAGTQVPRDVGVVELRNERPELNHAGVCNDHAKIGALAVEALIGLIQRGEHGIPTDPHEILLPGRWLEGGTLPDRQSFPPAVLRASRPDANAVV